MFRLLLLFCCVSLCAANLHAQKPKRAYNKFWVQFADKKGTPFSELQPENFLSARALERRARQGIAIEWTDLPVTPAYVQALRDQKAVVLYVSRWLNGAVVYAEPDTLKGVRTLPFVTGTRPIGYLSKPSGIKAGKTVARTDNYPREANPYGKSFNQIAQLNGEALHQVGFDGERIVAAVFDGGFASVNTMPAFDSLFQSGRILGTHDFVEGDDYVYESSNHGTNVLSCMAANIPGVVVGTGPGASFYLFKTEDVGAELVQEEYNWLAAAEYADSLGVDVINSSLGYTTYDDSTMTYTYADLNGDKTVIARAADFAAQKGILVVNSAGNSGGDKWKYIGTPADADSILAVGAVDKNGEKAYFSSFGPTVDGRIKPNVSARGYGTVVADASGYTTGTANGTSFSSPVMAGMASALWDAFPERSAQDVIQALQASSNQATKPDEGLGYGIPDVTKAYHSLAGSNGGTLDDRPYQVVPGVVDSEFEVFWEAPANQTVYLELHRNTADLVRSDSLVLQKGRATGYRIDLGDQPDGFYSLYIREPERTRRLFFYKRRGGNFVAEEKQP